MIDGVVNLVMYRDGVMTLLDNGVMVYSGFDELEYPYFYSDIPLEGKSIVRCQPYNLKVFTGNEYVQQRMYKISYQGYLWPRMLIKEGMHTAEAYVNYLDRRLGADRKIVFTDTLKRYAYVDIEERGAAISWIGVISFYDGAFHDYVWFKTAQEFIKYLADNTITAVLAWNGYSYDYKRISKFVEADEELSFGYKFWWDLTLKLDAMELYAVYMRKGRTSLEKTGTELGLGGKIQHEKSFDEMNDDDLYTYNKRDVELLRDIVETTGILKLNMLVSRETGIKPDKIQPIRMLENLLIMNKFSKEDAVMADNMPGQKAPYEGAIVAGMPGVFNDVVVFDVNSMYPNLIIHADYHGKNEATYYLIRELVKGFLAQRARYKQLLKDTGDSKYDLFQDMYKIFANSVYGAMGNAYFRFYTIDAAAFITKSARDLNMRLRKIVADLGYSVIYGDTDSVFVANAVAKADELEAILNTRIYPLQLKIDKTFVKMLIPMSDDGKIKKKKYAGVTPDGKVLITGFETVRKDWCELTRDTEREVLTMILKNGATVREVETFVNTVTGAIRGVNLERLLFVKSFDPNREYAQDTRTLKVARELDVIDKERAFVFVRYLIGFDGKPIAVAEGDTLEKFRHMVDYRWYVTNQIWKPIKRIETSLGVWKATKLEAWE